MTSIKDFTKRVFGTSKIMTAVAVVMIVVSVVMGGLFVAGWADKEAKEGQFDSTATVNDLTKSGPAPAVDVNPETASTMITAQELAQHSSLNDCWMIIGSGVYNLTSFLRQHPGGVQSMAKYCGQDGTQGFETLDRGQGQSHSSSASMLKEDYRIGTLAN